MLKFIVNEESGATEADLSLFGFTLSDKKKKAENSKEDITSFVSPNTDDGSSVILSAGTHQIAYHDFSLAANTQSDIARIKKYREIANYPEVNQAIEEIINEVIVSDDEFDSVEISLDESSKIPEKVKKIIKEEFDEILKLLNFKADGQDEVLQWYVDGRRVYHVILNEKKDDIVELRPIDPVNIKKVKEVEEVIDPVTQVKVYKTKAEYYIYNEVNVDKKQNISNTFSTATTGLKISKDSIIYVPSGLLDEEKKNTISYLHKVIKVANQLKMLEDSTVIYRLVRSPERRVFRVDVGNLPAKKAEAYLQSVISKYRNKVSYDANTGELSDGRNQLAMIEDFWLPGRASGSGGTQIDTLPSGQNLGEIDDILYFQKKLFRSLNVPLNRLEQESAFSMGRSSEITRDEVKFSKFVQKIRSKFSELFYQALRIKLLLKRIITQDEWEEIKDNIFFNFLKDNYFTELKEAELLRERLVTLREIDDYSGKYFSKEWIQRNVLRMTDDDIKEIKKQMDKEQEEAPDEAPDDSLDSYR